MTSITPPIAPKRPVRHARHGEVDEDPYAWLRVENWREAMRDPSLLDAEVRAHLEAENAYTEAMLAPVAGLRERLFAEMKARIKEDDSTVPAPDGPYLYYRRFEAGGQHPVFCRRAGAGGTEEVLLDEPREATGLPFFRVARFAHAPDHAHAAYAVDLTGAEAHTIRFKELSSGRVLDDRLEGAHGDIAWANDARTLFYTVLDDNHRPSRIYRHRLGEGQARDALVYEETDPSFYISLDKTEDRRFIVIDAHDHAVTSEARLIDADAPASAPRLVAPRAARVEYHVSSHSGRLVIRTNADGAEDFKIVEAPLDAPGRESWREIVPREPGRLIRAVVLFAGHLVRLERAEGLARIVIRRLKDGAEHAIAFADEAYDLGVLPGHEFDTTTLRFTYSSLATPERTYDYDMETRARTLRKEQEVPSGHDPAAYETRRVMAPGHDGALVPVSLLWRKGTPLDGTAPLLLYGYGAYGLTIPAAFQPNRLSLVDRGFVYAIAHIRGGTDKGYAWYTDGKLANKANTFRDFIAAAEHLIAARYTGAGRIVAHGGSAGGMLMGVVANMRPELFKAIVAEVPFVDVLNTMCDGSLPLTPPEWTEWGNPVEDAEAYRRIRAYSPYDNVAAKAYPHILATAGVSDPRVTYWEPAKWVARLRAAKPAPAARLREARPGGRAGGARDGPGAEDNLLLLRTNMEAGHAGAAGRFERLEEVALAYAFILMVFGITE